MNYPESVKETADAWRFKLENCPICQSGEWETQAREPEEIDFEEAAKVHGYQYKEGSVEAKQPMFAGSTVLELAESCDSLEELKEVFSDG